MTLVSIIAGGGLRGSLAPNRGALDGGLSEDSRTERDLLKGNIAYLLLQNRQGIINSDKYHNDDRGDRRPALRFSGRIYARVCWTAGASAPKIKVPYPPFRLASFPVTSDINCPKSSILDANANFYTYDMLLSSFRRPRRRRRAWLRLALVILLVVLSADFLLTIAIDAPSKRVPPVAASSIKGSTTNHERVYIASMHWNNEFVIRSRWSAAVLDLVKHFGADNVYVSILESGSWDDTKGALRDLDLQLEELGVERSVELLETTHKDEIERTPGPLEEGWIGTSRGRKELRRIPYLAGIRNRVMEKLNQLAERSNGQGARTFDKILWLNDVVFTVNL